MSAMASGSCRRYPSELIARVPATAIDVTLSSSRVKSASGVAPMKPPFSDHIPYRRRSLFEVAATPARTRFMIHSMRSSVAPTPAAKTVGTAFFTPSSRNARWIREKAFKKPALSGARHEIFVMALSTVPDSQPDAVPDSQPKSSSRVMFSDQTDSIGTAGRSTL